MSSTAEVDRLSRNDALDLASQAMRSLGQYCERMELAGSIRRRTQTVGDIELVVVPKYDTIQVGLFEDDVKLVSRLDTAIASYLLTHGTSWALRLDSAGRSRNGPKHKALTFQGFGLDLFIVTPPAQWGVIFTIRTGPWFWSKQLVTHQNVPIFHPHTSEKRWGLLPLEMKFQDGGLYRGALIPTPEESNVFAAVGIKFREPWERK